MICRMHFILFNPFKGRSSCPPVLSGHDIRDEIETPMATGRAATSQKTQKATTPTQRNSNNQKNTDWNREETEELLQAWGPKYEQLKKVSTKERARIWSDIYNKYKERFIDSVRTLPQLKKRIQNLEYEFKNLKLRAQKTGEEGFKKIKQSLPYYDYFDTVVGQRDSVDPSRMQIESTVTFSESSDSSESNKSRASESKEVQSEEEDSSNSSTSKQEKKTAVGKRKMNEKGAKSSRKGKKWREDSDSDWQERLENMWERSLEQERESRESTHQILRESLRSQMEQTNAIMAGFKDIFQSLLK